MDVGSIVRNRMNGRMYIVHQKREILGIGYGKVGKMYIYDIITGDESLTVDEPTMRSLYTLVTTTGVPANVGGIQVGKVVNIGNVPSVIVSPIRNLVCVYNIMAQRCTLVDGDLLDTMTS